MSKNTLKNSDSEWVLVREFAKRTGKTAEAVRKNINSGGSLFKYSRKNENRLWIDIRGFFNMLDDLTF